MNNMKREKVLYDSSLIEKKAEEYATTMSKEYSTDVEIQNFLHDAIMAAYLKGADDFYQMINK